MSFHDDITEQRRNELIVAAAFARQKKALLWPNANGLDSAKDFTLFESKKYELKWDKKAAETGRMYFEFHNTKQDIPSGIKSTKADCWLHFVPPDRMFVCGEPDWLFSILEGLVAVEKAFIVEGGDDNSRGIVVPIDNLIQTGAVEEMQFNYATV